MRLRTVAFAVVASLSVSALFAAGGDDAGIDPAHPDVHVLSVPTTLSPPGGGFIFRVTHRFSRPLGQGDLGEKVEDFFGLDSSAQVGLELRVGLGRGLQAGVYRLSDRTISLFAQQRVWRPDDRPFGLSVLAALEGENNLREEHAPHVALLLSRTLGERGALYVAPAWTGNTNTGLERPGVRESSVTLGLGARYGLSESYYVVAEVVPVIRGYKGIRSDAGGTSAPHLSFGLERHAGGHVFQLNVSNSIGTTPANVARGQDRQVDDWYLGFNLSRKFY